MNGDPPLPAWPLLVARLRHLLVSEGYGHARNRYPGNVPVAARARSGRHLLALGPAAVARLREAFPEVVQLPIWPDLHRLMDEGGPGAAGAPVFASERGAPIDGPPDILERGGPLPPARALVRRLRYLRKEEFDDLPIGLLSLSRAWRALRDVDALDPQLLSAYLDSTDTVEKEVVRFCLRTRGLLADLEYLDDEDFTRRIAAAIDRYPMTLAGASPAEIERFRRAGLVSASFDPAPSGSRCAFADGRFVVEGPFPGSAGNSLDTGIDHRSGEPVLVTKLFVTGSEAIPAERELDLPHEGVAPLLYLARTRLPEGLANVLVEALPLAARSDQGVPLGAARATALADRVAAILESVHASGRCLVGLRPELTFVDPVGRVTLVPRSELLRRLSWPEGPAIEGQQPPFPGIYLAAETLLGAAPSAASDVYSLCAMLVYWAQGRAPFARDSTTAQLRAMMNEAPDCVALPEPLRGVVRRGLSPEAARRPTVAELRRSFVRA